MPLRQSSEEKLENCFDYCRSFRKKNEDEKFRLVRLPPYARRCYERKNNALNSQFQPENILEGLCPSTVFAYLTSM